jgi:hypothetical protein
MAPAGTDVAMLVGLQLVTVAVAPLNVTELPAWVAPKFVPVIVTAVPTGPEVVERLVMVGVGEEPVTVKLTPLLATPPTLTTTFPLVAPEGTEVTRLVALQLVTVATVWLKVTVLVPCVAPKFVPAIVTVDPIPPDVGVKLVIAGPDAVTVKATALLATPPTFTTTFPVVAPVGTDVERLDGLQLVTVAAVPLKVTLLVPCTVPKFVPAIVTVAPTGPLVALRPVIVGGAAVTVIVRVSGLGSVTPLLSVTVSEATNVPDWEKVTEPGLASELVPGLPLGKTHEYPEIVPLGLVPPPLNETDWPGEIVTLPDGLVMFPVGGWSFGVSESWTNCATEGTPEEFKMKRR